MKYFKYLTPVIDRARRVKKTSKLLEVVPGKKDREITKEWIESGGIDKNISKLKKKELIKRIGSPRGGYWEIIE